MVDDGDSAHVAHTSVHAGRGAQDGDGRGGDGTGEAAGEVPGGFVLPTAGDEVEQALLEVRALIEATVAKHRDRTLQSRLVSEIAPDDGALVEAAARLMAEAAHEVDVVVAAEPVHTRALLAALDARLAVDDSALQVRVLCTRATLERGIVLERLSSGRSVEIRVATLPFLETVIVDGRVAVVRAERAGGRQAAVIHADAVIHVLQSLFLGVWRKAGPLGQRIDFGDAVRTEFARQILLRLHAGATDEAAARDLSVSVRTYRRYVAEIMELLGVTSRFQAGARAAELGLIRPRP